MVPKDVEKGRAFGHLGNCYEALTDFEEAAKCHEQYLSHSLKSKSVKDQDKAYRELGQAYKHLGNLQQALVSEFNLIFICIEFIFCSRIFLQRN